MENHNNNFLRNLICRSGKANNEKRSILQQMVGSYQNKVKYKQKIKKITIRGDRILDVSTVYFILSSSASLTFIIYHRSHKNHFLICHQQNLISSKMRFSYIPQKYLERENETTRQGINAIKIQALYYSFRISYTKKLL